MVESRFNSSKPSNFEQAFAALGRMLGTRFSQTEAIREHHGRDESYHMNHNPDAVAFPKSNGERLRNRSFLNRDRSWNAVAL